MSHACDKLRVELKELRDRETALKREIDSCWATMFSSVDNAGLDDKYADADWERRRAEVELKQVAESLTSVIDRLRLLGCVEQA